MIVFVAAAWADPVVLRTMGDGAPVVAVGTEG